MTANSFIQKKSALITNAPEKICSFYSRKKCKFEEKFSFKHEGALNEDLKSETARLVKKVESLESDNEKFKNVIENKDFVVLAKATQIKYIENDIEKSVDEIKKLNQDNSKKEK